MQIAKLLQEEKVLNPTAYKKREGIKTPSPETADPLVASGTAPGASDTCAAGYPDQKAGSKSNCCKYVAGFIFSLAES